MIDFLLRIDAAIRRLREWWCSKIGHDWIVAPARNFRVCARCPVREVRVKE